MRFITLVFLLISILHATPDWFYNLKSTHNNELIGYGIDDTLSKAKQNASISIAETISIKIQSSVNSSKSNINGKYNKNFSTKMKSESKAILTGIEVLKSEQLLGKWYVAVKYDNSTLEEKIKKLLSNKLKDENQNLYLKDTLLIKNLNNEVEKRINYKLIRKNNLWQIQYKDITLPITQNNLYNLFLNKQNKAISIKANKKNFKQNNKIHFNIKHNKPGYISILYVEHNGKVGVIQSNYKSKKSFTYPDKKNKDTFTISNPYKQPIQEMYIAIYSDTKIDLGLFERVSDDLLDTSNFNFDKLIDILSKVEFSSYVIKIKE